MSRIIRGNEAHQAALPMLILAGGYARRLRPMSATIPKSLIPINGEPFIYHQLRLLQQHGFEQIVLCVGYLGEMIEAELGDGKRFGVNIVYSYDGDGDGNELLGTGGAIKQAITLFNEDAFFVMYGDAYLNCDYRNIQTTFENSQPLAMLAIFKNANLWDKSNIEYAQQKIIAYDKRKPNANMDYIDYGVSILTKRAVVDFKSPRHYDLTLLYQALIKQQQLAAYEVTQRFYEVGSFAGIQDFTHYLAQMKNQGEKDAIHNKLFG